MLREAQTERAQAVEGPREACTFLTGAGLGGLRRAGQRACHRRPAQGWYEEVGAAGRYGSPLRLRHSHSMLSAPTTTPNTHGDSHNRSDSLRPSASARVGSARAQRATCAADATRPPVACAIAAIVRLSGWVRASSRLQRSTANSLAARPRSRPPSAARALTR